MYTHGCIQHRQCNEKKSSTAKAHMGHRIRKHADQLNHFATQPLPHTPQYQKRVFFHRKANLHLSISEKRQKKQ